MEEHRLKEMVPHDSKVFNQIYQDVEGLIVKLSYGIDERRLGVTKEDIQSFFRIKFIYVFNKYYNEKDTNVLKGFIINALKLYKNRIIKNAYAEKNAQYSNSVDLTEIYSLSYVESEDDANKDLMGLVLNFMRIRLSETAYEVFILKYKPNEEIVTEMYKRDIQMNDVPMDIIADYLSLSYKEVKKIQKEIRGAIKIAKEELSPSYSLAF